MKEQILRGFMKQKNPLKFFHIPENSDLIFESETGSCIEILEPIEGTSLEEELFEMTTDDTFKTFCELDQIEETYEHDSFGVFSQNVLLSPHLIEEIQKDQKKP